VVCPAAGAFSGAEPPQAHGGDFTEAVYPVIFFSEKTFIMGILRNA